MESTFLLHKPVSYGSSLANYVFLTMLLLHIIAGAIAPISAIVSFIARKGSKSHVRSGRFLLGRWSSWHYRCRARRGSTLLFREREPYKIRRLYHAQHLSGTLGLPVRGSLHASTFYERLHRHVYSVGRAVVRLSW